MLMPSIFGESLFDDFFTPFYYDDKDEKKAEKKLYGHRAQNLLKTDIKETKEAGCCIFPGSWQHPCHNLWFRT